MCFEVGVAVPGGGGGENRDGVATRALRRNRSLRASAASQRPGCCARRGNVHRSAVLAGCPSHRAGGTERAHLALSCPTDLESTPATARTAICLNSSSASWENLIVNHPPSAAVELRSWFLVGIRPTVLPSAPRRKQSPVPLGNGF